MMDVKYKGFTVVLCADGVFFFFFKYWRDNLMSPDFAANLSPHLLISMICGLATYCFYLSD